MVKPDPRIIREEATVELRFRHEFYPDEQQYKPGVRIYHEVLQQRWYIYMGENADPSHVWEWRDVPSVELA